MTDFTPKTQDDEDIFLAVDDDDDETIELRGDDDFAAAAPEPEQHDEEPVSSRSARRRAEGDARNKLLTPVTERMNTNLLGDDVHAEADYAVVSETGVSYVVRLGEGILAEILVGSIASPDDENFPREQLKESIAGLNWGKLQRYFDTTYGAELLLENEFGSLALSFHLPYDDAGIEESSIEYMGYRVMQETKLPQVHVDNLLGETIVAGAAAALGYVWSDTEQRYTKVQVVSYSANREQYRLMQNSATEFYGLSNKAVTSNRGKWSKAADLYSAAANRVYDIGSRSRKSDISVEAQLRRDSAGYRMAAGNELDPQTRDAYLDLADRFTEIAREAEALA